MNCSLNVAASIIQLCGIAVAGLIGYLSARAVSRRNEKVIATAKLRAAFAPALAEIEIDRHFKGTHDRPDVEAALKTAFPAHAAAVEEFRPYVLAVKQQSYQLAWERYRRSVQDHIVDAWDTAITLTGEHEWHVVAKNIHALLGHAET